MNIKENIMHTQFNGNLTLGTIKKSLLLVALLATTTMANTSSAGEHDMKNHDNNRCEHHQKNMHGGHDGMMIPPHFAHLNLTEEQKDKLFAIAYADMPKMREAEKSRHKNREALRELGAADNFNDASAQTLASQIADSEKQAILMRVRAEAKMYAVLTTAQKEQLKKDKAEFDKNKPFDSEGKPSPANFRHGKAHNSNFLF
jgi:Spy/CpxP family protein refolding chaperone